MARQFGERNHMKTNTISRRHFAQLLGVGAACAVARPSLALAKSVQQPAAHPVREGVVRLSSNENPFGPSPRALKAMTEAFNIACRYPDERADELVSSLAKMNGVDSSQILLGDGSGEILKLCADVFTGPLTNTNPAAGRGALVVADPTFEAILVHAKKNEAEVVKVPLTDSYAHDLTKMMASVKEGLVYICNPNNPTASITPKNEVRSFIEKAPPKTMVLVDEAYYHFADSADYDSVIPLVKDHPNLIVARTFSKIYGMAGLRCGYCVASSMTIERLRARQAWDSINIMAVAAATASLDDADLVAKGRQLNADTRAFTIQELEKLGYETIPSQANFIMIDLKRPVVPIIASLHSLKVDVGRLFHAMPNHLRLTIGRKTEMESFLGAFRQVMT
jgi:histidinol-phosphate aminotransferase